MVAVMAVLMRERPNLPLDRRDRKGIDLYLFKGDRSSKNLTQYVWALSPTTTPRWFLDLNFIDPKEPELSSFAVTSLASRRRQPYRCQQPISASLSNPDQTNLNLSLSLTQIKPRPKNLREKKFQLTKRDTKIGNYKCGWVGLLDLVMFNFFFFFGKQIVINFFCW